MARPRCPAIGGCQPTTIAESLYAHLSGEQGLKTRWDRWFIHQGTRVQSFLVYDEDVPSIMHNESLATNPKNTLNNHLHRTLRFKKAGDCAAEPRFTEWYDPRGDFVAPGMPPTPQEIATRCFIASSLAAPKAIPAPLTSEDVKMLRDGGKSRSQSERRPSARLSMEATSKMRSCSLNAPFEGSPFSTDVRSELVAMKTEAGEVRRSLSKEALQDRQMPSPDGADSNGCASPQRQSRSSSARGPSTTTARRRSTVQLKRSMSQPVPEPTRVIAVAAAAAAAAGGNQVGGGRVETTTQSEDPFSSDVEPRAHSYEDSSSGPLLEMLDMDGPFDRMDEQYGGGGAMPEHKCDAPLHQSGRQADYERTGGYRHHFEGEYVRAHHSAGHFGMERQLHAPHPGEFASPPVEVPGTPYYQAMQDAFAHPSLDHGTHVWNDPYPPTAFESELAPMSVNYLEDGGQGTGYQLYMSAEMAELEHGVVEKLHVRGDELHVHNRDAQFGFARSYLSDGRMSPSPTPSAGTDPDALESGARSTVTSLWREIEQMVAAKRARDSVRSRRSNSCHDNATDNNRDSDHTRDVNPFDDDASMCGAADAATTTATRSLEDAGGRVTGNGDRGYSTLTWMVAEALAKEHGYRGHGAGAGVLSGDSTDSSPPRNGKSHRRPTSKITRTRSLSSVNIMPYPLSSSPDRAVSTGRRRVGSLRGSRESGQQVGIRGSAGLAGGSGGSLVSSSYGTTPSVGFGAYGLQHELGVSMMKEKEAAIVRLFPLVSQWLAHTDFEGLRLSGDDAVARAVDDLCHHASVFLGAD